MFSLVSLLQSLVSKKNPFNRLNEKMYRKEIKKNQKIIVEKLVNWKQFQDEHLMWALQQFGKYQKRFLGRHRRSGPILFE